MKVDGTGDAARRRRSQQHVVQPVRRREIGEPAQSALAEESRKSPGRDSARIEGRVLVLKEIGDGMRGAPARLERGVNAAGSQRRYQPGRVSDQQHLLRGEGLDTAADRNRSAAAGDGSRRAEIEQVADLLLECLQVDAVGSPCRKPDLRDAMGWRRSWPGAPV